MSNILTVRNLTKSYQDKILSGQNTQTPEMLTYFEWNSEQNNQIYKIYIKIYCNNRIKLYNKYIIIIYTL